MAGPLDQTQLTTLMQEMENSKIPEQNTGERLIYVKREFTQARRLFRIRIQLSRFLFVVFLHFSDTVTEMSVCLDSHHGFMILDQIIRRQMKT